VASRSHGSRRAAFPLSLQWHSSGKQSLLHSFGATVQAVGESLE
jgi:hypothetical protein